MVATLLAAVIALLCFIIFVILNPRTKGFDMNDFSKLEATIARVKASFVDLTAQAAAADQQPAIDAADAELSQLAPLPVEAAPVPVDTGLGG
jgi:hypothetical protein